MQCERERERERIKAAEDKAEAEAKAAALEGAELQKKSKLRETVAAEAEDSLADHEARHAACQGVWASTNTVSAKLS